MTCVKLVIPVNQVHSLQQLQTHILTVKEILDRAIPCLKDIFLKPCRFFHRRHASRYSLKHGYKFHPQ